MRKLSAFFLVFGALMILAAMGLTGYNIWDGIRADKASKKVTDVLAEEISAGVVPNEKSPELPAENEEPEEELNVPEMPTIKIDGYDYIGILEIDDIGMSLAVMDRWDYTRLKIAPCRYAGSAYEDNLIICAHNYPKHFTPIKTLPIGTYIRFTDTIGNVFEYVIVSIEILDPINMEGMLTEDWDLTLFTCTTGGQTRHVVRCERVHG